MLFALAAVLLFAPSKSRELPRAACRWSPLQSPPMTTSANNAAVWAIGAANQFRAVARTTENLTTKALAEGLVQSAEAIRELAAK